MSLLESAREGDWERDTDGAGSTQTDCETCTVIFRVLRSNDPVDEQLGEPQNIASSACHTHRELIEKALKVNLSETRVKMVTISKLPLILSTRIHGEISDEEPTLGSSALALINEPVPSIGNIIGLRVDPHWIDIAQLLEWKHMCDMKHGSDCNQVPLSMRSVSSRPTWLIDVWQRCLVPCPYDATYVALSYVWGQRRFLVAKRSNIADLQQPYALNSVDMSTLIPATVSHAIDIVKNLKERHLWVDSLCIVQDDEVQKKYEIEKMAAIYSQATLTIVAADGKDAFHGINGFRGISSPRSIRQDVFQLNEKASVIFHKYTHGYRESYWATRGWTFQERLCSTRRIILFEDRARWECKRCTWDEDIEEWDQDKPDEDKISLPEALLGGSKMFFHKLPNIYGLVGMINEFNSKNLTYPEDILDAFTGVASKLAGSLENGFISGLPALFFDIALLWMPAGELRQRKSKGNSLTKACLPSWSWAGWHGQIQERSWSSITSYVRNSRFASCSFVDHLDKPLVQWYYQETKDTSLKPIMNTWQTWQRMYNNSLVATPIGWTRHLISEASDCHTGCPPLSISKPEWFYRHVTEPDSTFWHPVPVPDPYILAKSNIASHYISCKTRRAFLIAMEPINHSWFARCLRDGSSADWLGVLLFHERPFPPSDPRWLFPGYAGMIVELVEVAFGSVSEYAELSEIEEFDHKERPRSGPCYEFYHLLYVEWEDGVAYRKGIGRAAKDKWEALELEPIDLVLG
ncbi:heterokaryon incompatibility protein-domain-containing protein [Hyaloscypha sp. PMI_1271]|nr:heterokaryon incompatibility protein-domain-containing protein [Hyaloscypha sp. PMI_1271]